MDSILLTQEALKLSPYERAQLIDALLESLDPAKQKEIDRAWLEESNDRLKAFQAGEINAISDEDIQYDDDAPRTDQSFWADAEVVTPKRRAKELNSMRFDAALYQWFEQRAQKLKVPTQSLMHEVLESYKKHHLEDS